MTHDTAQDKLAHAAELIFEVENVMDVNKSNVRILGYRARMAIAEFRTQLSRNAKRGEDSIKLL
jgi:hypothetical protein